MQETSFTTNYEPGKSSTKLEKRQNKTSLDGKDGNDDVGKEERSVNIADRLSNIEGRLTELEKSITNNFNQIIQHIRRKEQ